MHENILAALVRLNKPETLGFVEPFHFSFCQTEFTTFQKLDIKSKPTDPIQPGQWAVNYNLVLNLIPSVKPDKI